MGVDPSLTLQQCINTTKRDNLLLLTPEWYQHRQFQYHDEVHHTRQSVCCVHRVTAVPDNVNT